MSNVGDVMERAVKNEKSKGKLILFAVFSLIFLFISIIIFGNTTNAYATSSANPIGEIWDSSSNKFNQKIVEQLYAALGGSNVTGTDFQDKFSSLASWAATPRTSADFRNNNGSNVVVTLGGKQWVAVYLTEANGNIVLTLMCTDASDSISVFNNFGTLTIGCYKYPADSYGSSYVRASLLSGNASNLNSTDDTSPVASYVNSAGASALTAMTAATPLGLEYANFTSGALSNYILTPEQVGYQELEEIGGGYASFPYSTSNDAYGAVPNTHFNAPQYNYYSNTTVHTGSYTRWKGDKIWMPSLAEIGFDSSKSGVWQADTDIRKLSNAQYYMTRSSGYSSHGGYYYFDNGVSHQNMFTVATTAYRVRPAIHLNLSATADSASSGIKKPTADTRTFSYTGSDWTYTPAGLDTDTMTISGNVQKNVKIKDGSTTHEADPNGYTVKVELKNGYNWYGGSTDDVEFKFVIKKAIPTVNVQCTVPNPLYVSHGLPAISHTGTPGQIKWDDNQIPSSTIRNYNWTFTPTDLDNYSIKKDKYQLTFKEPAIQGIRVVVNKGSDNSDVDIYDRYDTVSFGTLGDYLKSCISVYILYSDNSVSVSPIPDADYIVTTTESQILVSSGSSETKSISVRITSSSNPALKNMTGSVNATVKKAEIEAMNVYPITPAPATLKYPVTLEQILANYEVALKWNFAPNREITAPTDKISVAIKSSADNPQGIIKAGTLDLTFTYSNNGLVETADLIGDCVIAKGDVDMSGITFSDKSEMYDGQPKSIEITGALPQGVTGVSYTSSGDNTSVGVYTITAKFTVDDNYNPVSDMTAVLTITNSGFDMSGITFPDKTVTYDGNTYTLEISGDLPDNRIVVTYTVAGQTGTSFSNAGVYVFTAKFSNPDPANYGDIPDMTATLTINKAELDMSGVSFSDMTVNFDGNAHTLEISGALPDNRIVVTYTVAGQTETSFINAGEYVFTAKFSNPDPANYEDIADMTATLKIEGNSAVNPNPPGASSNDSGILEKIKRFFDELIEKNFPLWQVITSFVALLFTLIFMIKAIQYGNRKKKAKGEAKKFKAYAALLPIFSTQTVWLNLSNMAWSIIAFSLVGAAILMFIIALITRKGWKKAELAKENAMSAAGYNPQTGAPLSASDSTALIAEMRREFQETLTQVNKGRETEDSSAFEKHLLELEERHREEMAALREEQRRENERREEEQQKRDEAMKIMLANMMGRNQAESGMGYASMDDTDLLVQKVIAGLLPMVQQMVPEPTAYLAAPSESSEDIKALTAQISSLQEQLANISADRVEGIVLPDQSEELRAMAAEHSAEMKAMSKEHSAEMQAISAKMELMQQKMDMMSAMSVDDFDDDDIDDDEEEWDSILDEDDDDFVEAVIIEEDGTVKKTYPNFRMRLKQSSDKNREWYAAVKNLFCSQKGVTYRVYKRVEKIRYQGQVIAVIGIAKRSIKQWLALKPYEYDARRYHHKDVSDKPRFVDVPMYVRVSSDRALTRAQELILALFQELNMEARKRYNDRSIQELIFTLKHNKLLTNKQNKGLLCEVMHVHDCDILSDELAEKCIESKNVESIDESYIETLKLDDIDAKFQDGNRVTLEKLKKVGLVSDECTGYTVTAGHRLTKPLIIVANDFTLPAVKMITLTGGRAIRLNKI